MPAEKKLLNRYEAALLVRISPKLLHWLTRYAAKTGETKKLPYENKKGELFFSTSDLRDFDKYLSSPWPKASEEARPHVPAGIVVEIKEECGCKCAICGESVGEVAHIDAVHNSANNHPHNLIYLCPNCHTKYDQTKLIAETQIRGIKKEILRVRMSLWRAQSGLLNTVFALIATLEDVVEEAKDNPAVIFSILRSDLATEIRERLSGESDDKTKLLNAHLKDHVGQQATEEQLFDARRKALRDSTASECPVCEGTGDHNNWECPVCRGVGTVDARDVGEIDLSGFEQVECPVCEGAGDHNNWECPVCRGVGTVDARDVNEIDLSGFEQVECPVCEGTLEHNNWECPVCRGVGTVDARDVSEIDLSGFEQVECPVCEGTREHNDRECLVCRGTGSVDARDVSEIDLSDFEQVECPLCEGTREHNDRECPVCRGAGSVDARDVSEIDLSRHSRHPQPERNRCVGL